MSRILLKNDYCHASMNIALLGFAGEPAPGNLLHAAQMARSLARRQWRLLTGNFKGTMGIALEHAHNSRAETLLVTEKYQPLASGRYLSQVIYAENQSQKHDLIATLADAAVVIGGGKASLNLVNKLLKQRKPVFAIRCSGGITHHELPKEVLYYSETEDVLAVIERYLSISTETPLASHA